MESDDVKMCKMQVRKVTQDVLMFVWFKHGVILQKPTPELSFVPEITAEFLKNLCESVWIESSRNEYVWGDFLKNHLKRMNKTPYLFTNYFAYASYILIGEAKDAHTCFLEVLSLVTHFTLSCWQEEKKEYLNSCVDLFCAFFDKELSKKFEDQGQWKNFNVYLKNLESFKRYKELSRANKPPNEIFKEFQSRHYDSNEPYVINNVVLKDVTVDEVENDKRAVSFADSVGDKMKEVCKKAFDEVLKDFLKTENEVEELYREMVGVASGEMASGENHSSSQEALENSSSKIKVEDPRNGIKRGEKSARLDTPVTDPLKSQYLNPSPQESNRSLKLNAIKTKSLLEEMLTDIARISELIRFVCEENSILVPIHVLNNANRQ